jgi:hypothetical protein
MPAQGSRYGLLRKPRPFDGPIANVGIEGAHTVVMSFTSRLAT